VLPKKSKMAIATQTSAWRKGKGRWPPLCRDCRRDPSRIPPPAVNSHNGQKNDKVQKRRGRKPGDTLINYEEFVRDAKACGLECLREVKFDSRALKQKDVLIKYHHKRPGDRIAAT